MGSDHYKVVVLFAGSILLLGSYQFNQLLLILVPVLFLGKRDLNRKKIRVHDTALDRSIRHRVRSLFGCYLAEVRRSHHLPT